MKFLILLPIAIVLIAGCTQSTGEVTKDGQQTPSVKEFNAEITGFRYSPEYIDVNLGDNVRINIKNNDGVTHGINLPIFGVREFVRPGQVKTIQFVANQRGNPETFCSTDHGEKLLIRVN